MLSFTVLRYMGMMGARRNAQITWTSWVVNNGTQNCREISDEEELAGIVKRDWKTRRNSCRWIRIIIEERN